MAIVTFRGDAPAIAQVVTITIDTYDAATTYRVTINGKTISVVGSGGTTSTVATALGALLTASAFPEFAELTFEVSTNTITATSNVAGQPFVLTTSETGGTGGLSHSTTTASSGPSDLSVLSNYSTGALPANGDTLVFENLSNGLLYGLTALSAIATLARVIFKNIKGGIGLAQWNAAGYWEYRDTYLVLDAAIVDFDCPQCPLGRLNLQTTACVVTVTNTGQSETPPLEALLIRGVNSANVLNANGGTVAIAGQYSEVSTFSIVNQGYNTQPEADSFVRIGRGTTLATINRIGGVMICEAGISGVLTQRSGAAEITILSGAFPTINHFAASAINYLSSGTITTLTLGANAVFSSERNQAGYIITNVVQAYLGASFLDKNRRATWAGIKANGCGIGSVDTAIFVDRGESRTWLDS